MPRTATSDGIVVDCSVSLAWFLEDERSDFTDHVLDLLAGSQAWVPALWRLEFANALIAARRRGRISEEWRAAAIRQASRLPVAVDTHVATLADISTLALRHTITTYDAAYLDLALRRNLPLATLDADLVRAAREAGHTVLSGAGAKGSKRR
jgi:predicted nucleic acid-binding protein